MEEDVGLFKGREGEGRGPRLLLLVLELVVELLSEEVDW